MDLRSILLSMALAALTVGCDASALRPKVAPEVRVDIALSAGDGSPSRPLTIRATAKNLGPHSVRYYLGCGCPGIGIELVGPQDEPVLLYDPCQPAPGCPCGSVILAPGEVVTGSVQFAGETYRRAATGDTCELVRTPAGTYTVIAGYDYSTIDPEGWRTIERRATFRWTNP